jgi:hypothetical protein
MKEILLIDYRECCDTEMDVITVEGIACYACRTCNTVTQITSYDASFTEVKSD